MQPLYCIDLTIWLMQTLEFARPLICFFYAMYNKSFQGGLRDV